MASPVIRSFGRRAGPRASAPVAAAARPTPAPGPVAPIAPPQPDAELQAWKQTRRWQPPWRQIALMASLCFGIASFVLPDTVNDDVQYLLWALAAAGLIAAWRKPGK